MVDVIRGKVVRKNGVITGLSKHVGRRVVILIEGGEQ